MQRLRKTVIQRWRYYLFYCSIVAIALLPQIARAQVGNQTITFEANAEPLANTITRLSKASRVNIGYPNDVKQYKRVSIPKASRTVLETLKALLKDTELDCKTVGEMLVVFKKSKAPATPAPTTKLINVNGKVVDETGQPLPAITIQLQGTDRGTITNGNGSFELGQVPEDASIVAQGIGFPAQSFPAASVMVLRLSRSISDLDEVQVIAYGTTTRRLNTGSVTSVGADEIQKQPISNPIAALEGRVPGLIVTQTSGLPGSALKIQLRGRTSLDLARSQNDPLFVIDGVPFEAGNTARNQLFNATMVQGAGGISPLTLIPPSEIESIDVLKDADATAIYGSRGANGVILITTKRGRTGQTAYNVNVNYGVSKVGRILARLNTQQYVAMRKEGLLNDQLVPSTNPADKGYAPDIMIFDTTRYTNFNKLLLGNTAKTLTAGVTVSGGSENTQFLIGGNYRRETTIYPGNFSDAMGSFQTSISHRSKDRRLAINFTSQYSNNTTHLPVSDLTTSLSNLIPNLLLYDNLGNIAAQDHGIALNNGSFNNPLYVLQTIYEIQTDNLNNSLKLEYTVFKGMLIRTSLGYSMMKSEEYSAYPTKSINPNNPDPLPFADFGTSSMRSWIVEPQLEYTSRGRLGNVNILLGTSFQDKSSSSLQTTGRGYTSDLLLRTIAGAATTNSSSSTTKYRYNAIFGRINYNFQDRYIVNLTGRRDGSTRFAPQNRWANFGAVGMGWIFTNENFWTKNQRLLSYGKVRSSYGITGNDQIGDYKYLDLWRASSTPYDGTSTLLPSSLYNRTYQWEINEKFEVAIELGFFKDRILFSGAFYKNRSNNQLVSYRLPIQTGFSSITRNFPGLVQNQGYEFSLSSRNITFESFSWVTSFNISVPENKLVDFPNLDKSPYTLSYVVGKSLSVIRGYKFLGMDTQTGMYKFQDTNGDGVYTTEDYVNFGDRDPKYYGGLQNTITYKGIELSFLLSFRKQLGNSYLTQFTTPPGYPNNQPILALDRWRQPGDIAIGQPFVSGPYNIPLLQGRSYYSKSDAAYTDASFIKLRNIAVSYSVNNDFIGKFGLKGCRMYAQAQNLFTVTNYLGSDPETQNLLSMPPLRTAVVGVNINF